MPRLISALQALHESTIQTAEAHLLVAKILSERPTITSADSKALAAVLRRGGLGVDPNELEAPDDVTADFDRISLSSTLPPTPTGSTVGPLGLHGSPESVEEPPVLGDLHQAVETLEQLLFRYHTAQFEETLSVAEKLSITLIAQLRAALDRESFEGSMAIQEYEQSRRGLALSIEESLRSTSKKFGVGSSKQVTLQRIDSIHAEQKRASVFEGSFCFTSVQFTFN